MPSERITFVGSNGDQLAARLDRPQGPVRAYALFAHCFTCSKDLFAVQRIASELALQGIAVLRFDFTGLGASMGEFANTNFSSNVGDLRHAAAYLATHYRPADLLIGHSLGGAAVLAAAGDLPEVKAVVTIGAPADTAHVIASFRAHTATIEQDGRAEVELAGRRFTITQQFLDDVRAQNLDPKIRGLQRPLLILHAPTDDIVGVDNAKRIFEAARHPKSFVSLDQADHLLSRRQDAAFVADIISAWCGRYLLSQLDKAKATVAKKVEVHATGAGRFQQAIAVGRHRLIADEPESYGGLGTGPSPYDFLSIALATCTSMTFQLYAERKGWHLPSFTVKVSHAKVHAKDCTVCAEGGSGLIDRFDRQITFAADPGGEVKTKAAEIADKCPVHRTLEAKSLIVTQINTAKVSAVLS
jgi:putative redox protein